MSTSQQECGSKHAVCPEICKTTKLTATSESLPQFVLLVSMYSVNMYVCVVSCNTIWYIQCSQLHNVHSIH